MQRHLGTFQYAFLNYFFKVQNSDSMLLKALDF